MRTSSAAAVTVVAIAVSLVLGTVGWFFVGFGVMTDCTNDYSCGSGGCSPCATTGRLINVGGVVQLLLAAAGVAVLVRGLRGRRSGSLARGGAVVLVASVVVFAGSTTLAQRSYCRPGSAGYDESYCAADVDG
jgi:hypothetical protein